MKLPIVFLSAVMAAGAADPTGLVYWPKGVPPSGGPKGAKFDNHGLGISHRDKDGVAELHENQSDIMVIQSGEAKLVVGGEVTGAKTESPGEIRGAGITNGVEKMLSAGDVIHIPFGMPHQFFVAPGKQITYFVVKVTKP